MKKILIFIFSLACTIGHSFSQPITGKLTFEQGDTLNISLKVKTTITQQVQGQALDFNIDATGDHLYRVTNSTEDNYTLHHRIRHISFVFDGMGAKRSFDSNEEKDMNGPFGKPVKEMLEKTYSVILDSTGKVLLTLPERIELTETDNRMAIISSLLKDITDLVHPPEKGSNSFFKILPDTTVSNGDGWVRSYENEKGKFDEAYAISDINDSTIVVNFATTSVTITKAEMMGRETTTTMNNKSIGKIILDRITGIMREKTINTESTGNTESSFGTLPVTSKTSIIIILRSKP